jgi:hypothetical protein
MKIEKLTKKQEARFEEFRNKWTAIGLNTDRANRSVAEASCREVYKVAGLEEPKVILWAQSPMGLLLTAKLVKEIAAKGIKPYADGVDSVWASVRDSVWASVRDSVGASVWDSVWASVRDSVRDSVGASVWASVWASVRDSVWASVWASVEDSVWDSVWASVGDSVGASVWASVEDSVGDSVWASVGDSVRDSVGASVWDSSLRSEWNDVGSWGQHDANWLGFYDYFREAVGLETETRRLIPLTNLAKETGWHLFYKNVAILSEKPTEIHRNEQGRLHKDGAPAIKWADGYELHRLNGINVSKEIAETPLSEISKDMILKQQNADIRRELVRRLGANRAMEVLDAKVIDTFESKIGGRYELVTLDIGDGRTRPYLKMLNPSIGETHIEGVRPEIKTVKEAICYRNGLTEFAEPKELS